ncbi:MAG: SAM-dependent methyltransferase [Methanospirillaceae archaeon]|nr:SAM-dependent methyltransferase [Methanospirillaceae archaeon]
MHTRCIPVSEIKTITSSPWIDTTRRPFVQGTVAYVPVKDGYPYDYTLKERKGYQGRGFQRIGDVIVFHGSRPTHEEISSVRLHFSPRGVIWIRRSQGRMRIPDIEILWGTAGEVLHRESGIVYFLNVEQVMFSQGNRKEKMRISSLIHPGESVADMFAGIGYFTLPVARAGGRVFAIELNPVSYQYLVRNCAVNNLDGNVYAVPGDCRDVMCGYYSRIIMGHFDSLHYLAKALLHVKKGSVIHLHGEEADEGNIIRILQEQNIHFFISSHPVKTIGPGKRHMVWDITIA